MLEELIFPDARADAVFTFSGAYFRARADRPGEAQRIESARVEAQRRHPVRIRCETQGGLIWVRFQPGGLAAFVPLPLHELTGHAVDLSDLFGPVATQLKERLFTFQGRPGLQAQSLDAFFLAHIALPPKYHEVMHLIRVIERRCGLVSVSDLSRAAGCSVRTVDRLFGRVVGLPPKFVARAVRFRHVHQALAARTHTNWGDIVASLGYVDESHLAKDTLSLTGVGPRAYRALLGQKESECLKALSRFYSIDPASSPFPAAGSLP